MLSETARMPLVIPSLPARTPMSLDETVDSPLPTEDRAKATRVGGLVLTRHLEESIMIGDEVEVQVVGIRSGTVRLKIVAPRTIAVHRREVFDSIQAEPVATRLIPPVSPATVRPGKPQGGLVLARSIGQSIMIGGDVELAIVEVRPSTVKLRITAPRSVAVHRREIFEAIREGGLS